MTFNATLTRNLTQYPYNISSIIESTQTGNMGNFFYQVNVMMDYFPMRALMFVLLLIFYTIMMYMKPQSNKYRILSVSGILVAMSVGVLSTGNLIPLTDVFIFIVISSITWFIGKQT